MTRSIPRTRERRRSALNHCQNLPFAPGPRAGACRLRRAARPLAYKGFFRALLDKRGSARNNGGRLAGFTGLSRGRRKPDRGRGRRRRCGLRAAISPASAAAATVFRRARIFGRGRRGAAGDRPQRRRQVVAAANDRGPGPGRGRTAGARRTAIPIAAAGAGALSRPPGRAEAVADGRREPRLLEPLSRRGGEPPAAALAAVGLERWPSCRPPTSRPASGGGCRSPGWSRCSARSGCSTSRPPRSTARRRTRSPA